MMGSIAFRHLHRPLGYKIFDKLVCVDQGAVVDNKRLGAVLRLAQQKQDELEAEGKRMRSTKMPAGTLSSMYWKSSGRSTRCSPVGRILSPA
jgi:hypothetical protein